MAEQTVERSSSELVGRAAERGTLAAFLDAMSAASATMVIQGEAGQGKSSLLQWTTAQARARGFTVVDAIGIEFEQELAYSGLSAVLRPLLPQSAQLGAAQRSALEVAVGRQPGEAPILTTYGATLDILSAAAAEQPCLVAVDDAQWIDRSSLEALVFAAHRGGADRLGFLFALRTGLPCLLDRTRFDRVEVGGLPEDAVVELLGRRGVGPEVAAECWKLTGGNPLALIEGVRALSAAQRAGSAPIPPALPVGARLRDAFEAQLDGLPEATVRALGVAALEANDDLTVVSAALVALGGDVGHFDPAERHDVLTLAGGRVLWRHPLVRAAIDDRVGGEWRRRAHRALADATQAIGRDDQALWHLSEAIVGPDDDLAARMSELGSSARRRGGLMAAAAAHERAAELSTSPTDRDRRLLAAGDARWAAGDLIGSADLFAGWLATAVTVEARAGMAMFLGQAELWTVGTTAAVERYEMAAAAAAAEHPELAAYLLLHACSARLLALEPALAVATAARAATLAARANDTAALAGVTAMDTLCRIFAVDPDDADHADHADHAGGAADPADRLGPLRDLLVAALSAGVEGADDLTQLCGFAFLVCERWAEAADLLDMVARSGETSGMMGRSALARLLLSEVLWRTGRWTETLAELSHSLTLQEAVRPGQLVPGTLALLARAEAGLGQDERCRAHVAQMIDTRPHIEMFQVLAHSAIGLLALGGGETAEAMAAFDEVVARIGDGAEPAWHWWHVDAIDAYLAGGREGDARRLLAQLEGPSGAAPRRGWVAAAAARGRGLLAEGDEADAHLTTALAGFRSVGAPFYEARTLLARGQRRIRSGDRESGARDVAAARTIFDRLGARTWSNQASALRGEAGGSDGSLTSRLTPAELRVALAVGRGASNRDAAEQLFVSVKTVDYHLQNIYRKLGLRSRAQLMTLVLADASPAPAH